MTDLAAALLRDVPRFNVTVGDHTDPSVLLLETDVLAALSAHLDAALAERVGGIVSELREVAAVFTKDTVFTDAADLITALLAQNAALRAERDKWMERCGRERAFASSHRIRAEAAEAREERLRGALEKIASAKDLESPSDYNRGWNDSRSRLREIARAALTTEADNG